MSASEPRKHAISGGELYFNSPIDKHFIVWRCSNTMRDPVDREILQRALDTTAALFPFFHVRAVLQSDENYVLEEIEEPFLAYSREEAIAPGDPAVQGSLITVGCTGNIIHNDFYHGVTDGRGLMEFQRHLLYYYCLYRYGGELKCQDILPPGTSPDPALYADFDDSGLSMTEVSPLNIPKERFLLPEKRRARNEKHVVYRITLNQKEFMKFSSANDGSPAVITALLLARAIAEVHPVTEQPIIIRMPVDLRKALNRPKTMRSCIGRLDLVYDDRIRKLPFAQQATCFRGMVFLQSDPPRLVNAYLTSRADNEAKKSLSLKERGKQLQPIIDNTGPLVSYTGQQNYGDVEQYRKNFTWLGDAMHNGTMIEVITAADNINISFVSALETDAYIKAFLHQMELVGIQYEQEEPVFFVPLFADLPQPE